jgi:CMP/dCMP kinase
MIITITGALGSGKSTVGKAIAKEMKLKHYSTGDYMRTMAANRGITLLELGKIAETDFAVDKEIDDWMVNLGKTKNELIVDSRLAWYFIPKSFKIFLDVTEEEGARRIFAQKRNDESYNTDFDKALENLKARKESEKKRYRELYGINFYDLENYDLVINTTEIPAEEVIKKIMKALE